MRRITLTFALTLWAGHADASVLFTPDIFTFQFKATFNDTATDTFCRQCTDADRRTTCTPCCRSCRS